MSYRLLKNLQFIHQYLGEHQKTYLEIIGRQIQKIKIQDRLVIIAPKKWGECYIQNRKVNRFSVFLFTLWKGDFLMAKVSLKSLNMPWLGLPQKSMEYEGLVDTIMYTIHTIFEVFTQILLENYIRKLGMTFEEIEQALDQKLQRGPF